MLVLLNRDREDCSVTGGPGIRLQVVKQVFYTSKCPVLLEREVCVVKCAICCMTGCHDYVYCFLRLAIICECDFDVIAITETWLKSTIDAATVRELTPKGYSHKLLSRSSRKGGGVALLYKSTIDIKNPVHNVYRTFEHI